MNIDKSMEQARKEFEKQKRAIWAAHEKEGQYTVPESVRRLIENEVGRTHDYETDLIDLEDAILSYMPVAIRYANAVRDKTQRQTPNNPKDGNQKRVYRRPLEKRLYLVEFVTERVVTFHNLINRSFAPHRRIGWKGLAESWSKRHPQDAMTADQLRTEFYRIVRDKAVRQEYFDRQDAKFAEFASEGFREAATEFAKGMQEALGKDFDKFDVGEPVELSQLYKNSRQPVPDWVRPAPGSRQIANFESMLEHNAIEAAKGRHNNTAKDVRH
jgi:hypothetical protein